MQALRAARGGPTAAASPTPIRSALEILPWLAGALSCAPLAWTGFPRGHDFPYELLRALEYGRALLEGQLVPYWAGNVYGGYGSPIFLYYAPGFSALTAALAGLVGSVATAAALALAGLSFAAVWIARRTFADATGDASAARVGTVVWVLSPYLIGDKLIRNADAELMALCLAPLALRGVLLADRRPRAALGWLAGGLALAIVSHNLTALTVAASAAVAALALHARAPWPVLGRSAAGLLLGLGISAWFWLPALSSLAWVRPEELLRGKFDFSTQWQSAAELFGYGRFFSAGAGVPIALAAGALAAWRAPASREKRLLLATLAAAALYLALVHPLSTALWRLLPGLAFFQFPWRLLGPLSFCAALAAALAFARLTARSSPAWRRRCEIALCLCAALNALPQLARGLASGPVPAELARALEPDAVRSLGLGVTVYDEYLPRFADRNAWRTLRPLQGPLLDALPAASLTVERERATRIVLTVSTREPMRIRLARWAFPGWTASYEGRALPLLPNRHGVLELELPAGDGTLALELRAPPMRRIGLALSGACALLLLGLLVWPRGASPRWSRARRTGMIGATAEDLP